MYTVLEEEFTSTNYELLEVTEKEQLNTINGLVMLIDSKDQMSDIIDWLMSCKKSPKLFVWIYSYIPLEYEVDIFLSVGVNEIITVNEQEKKLVYLVSNTFKKLDYYENNNTNTKAGGNDTLINEKSKSVSINEEEVFLTKSEFKIFSKLYENLSTTISYEELYEVLWPDEKKTFQSYCLI